MKGYAFIIKEYLEDNNFGKGIEDKITNIILVKNMFPTLKTKKYMPLSKIIHNLIFLQICKNTKQKLPCHRLFH